MLHSGPLLQPLLQLVEAKPDFVVLYNADHILTAKELLQKSINVASGLSKKGFKKNDIAAIAAQPGEEFLEIMYAVIMLQGKIAIIDPEMGKENYAAKMKQLQPQWMFIDSRLLLLQEHPFLKWTLLKIKKTLPNITLLKGTKLVAVGKGFPVIRRHISFSNLQKPALNSPAFIPDEGLSENLIIYTSGTLQTPKGVLHTAKNLDESIRALSKLFTQNKNTFVGTYLPHFMLLGIAAGLTVKLMRPDLPATKKIDFIKKESIGILFGPPSDYMPLIKYCEQKKEMLPACLQHVMIGSAPVHVLFLKRLIAVLPPQTQITCTYGMTENLLVSVIDGRQKVLYKKDGDIAGKPVSGVNIIIAEDGEICIKSPQMFSRYFHEEASKEWHNTGDLGKIDEQGNIILSGRKKEMIIRRNMNIYPALYENTIKHIEGVDEAAMVGIYSEILHDEKVYLAVEGKGINVQTIKKQLANGAHSIDKEALPDHILKMTIPRKGRQNKIDRKAIIEYIKKSGL
ncbi:MAG: class I adenylate-forming enzyme family protein [Ginsengibacter sp.]